MDTLTSLEHANLKGGFKTSFAENWGGCKAFVSAHPIHSLAFALGIIALSCGDLMEVIPLFTPVSSSPFFPFFHEIHDLLALGLALFVAYKWCPVMGMGGMVFFLAVHIPYFFVGSPGHLPEVLRIVFLCLAGILGIYLMAKMHRIIIKLKQTEEELRLHRGNLIDMVEQRTVKLKKTNEEYLREINDHKRTEESLYKKTRLVQLLQDVTVAANESKNLDEVFQFAVDRICDFTGWPIGHAYLFTKNGILVSAKKWHLDDIARYGTFHDITEAVSLAPGVGLPGRVFTTGNPAWIPDVTKDPNFPRAKLAKDIKIRGGFAFPITIGSDVVAVLEFFSDKTEEPDATLLELMAHVGTQLGRVVERERAKKMLSVSEERFRSVVQTAVDAIILADSKGRIVSWNKGAQSIFGYTEEEVIAQSLTIVIPERYRGDHQRGIERVCSTGETRIIGKTIEAHGLKKDGREFPIELSLALWKTEEGTFFTGIIRDTSERKKLEDQLRHTQKMEAVGELAGGVAHEFNNMLTIIKGFAELLKMKMEKGDPSRDSVETILKAADGATNLIRSLLTFSRKHIINPGVTNLQEIIDGVKKLLSKIVREDIELRITNTSEDIKVIADRAQLEQVLINLVNNAQDAMPDGGLLSIETCSVEIDNGIIKNDGYGTLGKYALISISDTGVGMDEKTRERIFEPFFTTKEIGKGTGLGLSIVYGIIKQHNGFIKVYSEAGKGTTFKIYLPMVKSEAEQAQPTETKSFRGGTETLMLVEDDPDINQFIKTLLEGFGYKVIVATDGEDAINKFKENKDKIQLLLLDVIMPRKNGKEVYDEIRSGSPNIKALFMSGYTGDIIQRRGLFEEGLHFISKPISSTELLQKLREVLNSKPHS